MSCVPFHSMPVQGYLRTWQGQYIGSLADGSVRQSSEPQMAWRMITNANGTVSLESNGQYLSAWPEAPFVRTMPHWQDWEHWIVESVGGGKVALKSTAHGDKWLCAWDVNDGGDLRLQGSRQAWEEFEW